MSNVLKFNNREKCLVWDTLIPFERECSSKVFYYENFQWCFELKGGGVHRCNSTGYDYWYDLYMVSKNQQRPPEPFHISSCELTEQNNPGVFTTHRISDVKCNLRRVYEDMSIRLRGRIKFMMLFPSDVGMPIDFKRVSFFEPEKPKSVAVGTSDGYGLLSRDFSKLLEDDLYYDVELQCGDQTFKAHKNILSTRSRVFSAMLRSEMLEGQTARVEVKDMKPDVCNLLLHYMYTGNLLELTQENAGGLYEAADRNDVDGLMKHCSEFLTMSLTPDNACEMLVLADAHSDPDFKESIIGYLIDEEIHLEDDIWESFSLRQPLLANEVLIRICRSKNKKRKVN